MIVALVMIRCERDKIPEAALTIAGFDGVSEVYSVTGEWDLVVVVRVDRWEWAEGTWWIRPGKL